MGPDTTERTEQQAGQARWLLEECERLRADLARVTAERDEARRWTDQDQPLPEDEAIHAAFPLNSKRYNLYAEAMRLVGAKRSKGALVDLVNWLLHREAEVRRDAERWHKARDMMTHEHHADAIGWTLMMLLPGDDPDAAIDAARGSET